MIKGVVGCASELNYSDEVAKMNKDHNSFYH